VRVRSAELLRRPCAIVSLSTAREPAVGGSSRTIPPRSPVQRYRFDPAKGQALLAEAGYTAQKPLSFK